MQRQKRLQKAQSDILWFGRHYFPQYFTMETPDFHREMLDKAVGALHKRKGLVIAAPRNHSKCVAGDTVVYTDTGRKLIKDVVVGDNVQTLDENMKLSFGTVSHTWASGVKDLYRVTTISGHSIETTLDHKFYTRGYEGNLYVPLKELAVGNEVGVTEGEFIWDIITQVTLVKHDETYDIEVEGTHNFVGNNFIVHNSTLFTFLFPLWVICTKQKHFIVIFSSSAMQAESFLIDIKGELEQNSLLLDDYGPLGGDKYGLTWRNGDIVVGHPTRDENGDYVRDAKGLLVPSYSSRIVARGSEASTRGLRYGAYRPDLILCQPSGNKVWTTSGMKEIEDIKIGDVVMTHRGHLGEVQALESHEYSGELIKLWVYGNAVDPITMTVDHPVWAVQADKCKDSAGPCTPICGRSKNGTCHADYYKKYEWSFVRADELKVHDLIQHPIDRKTLTPWELEEEYINTVGPIKRIVRIKERNDKGQVLGTETSYRLEEHSEVQFVHDPRFWRLVGYWIGDGTITKSKPGRIGYEVSWTFGLHEKEYGEDVLSILREVLNKAGTFQEVKNGDKCYRVASSGRELNEFLSTLRIGDKSGDKAPHWWMEHLPVEYQKEFLLGYWRADGSKDFCYWKDRERNTPAGYPIVSVSKPMMESVQRIGWRLGLVSTIRYMRKHESVDNWGNGRSYKSRVCYDVNFGRDFGKVILGEENTVARPLARKQWIDGDFVYAQVKSVEREDVQVPVYSFTVDHEDHSYVGNHIATHNCDDIDAEDSILTLEQRMKVKSWWHKAVEPMLDPVEGVSIMVGTILHFDSLLSYMLSRDDVYDTFKYQAIQEDGTSLWPARWPIERLEEERRRLGTAAFGQEYLNNPLDDDARKFRPEWLTFYHLRELEYIGGVWRWNGKKLRIYQAYDLAIRQREQADKFAYAVIGVTAEHEVLILQSVGMHIDFPGQVRTVIEQWEIWRPERVGIETIGYQEALQQQIMNQALIPIVPIKKRGDKTLRITRMTPFFEQGKVLLRAADDNEPGSIDPEIGVKVHTGMKDLLTELMQYPRTAHDDLLDALEMALSLGQLSPGVQKISFDATGRDDYGGKMVNVAMKQNRPDEIPIPTQKTIWEYGCPSCHKPVTIKRLNDEYLCMSCGLWSLPEKRLIHL